MKVKEKGYLAQSINNHNNKNLCAAALIMCFLWAPVINKHQMGREFVYQ